MSEFKYSDPRPTAVMDTECYVNYWSIGFRDVASSRVVRMRRMERELLDIARVAKIFRNWRVISFNGNNYDMPMIALAMSGASNGALKRASDIIIQEDLKPWQFYDRFDVRVPGFVDHIDLMEVSPGSPAKPSLKLYAGRLHSKRMQDLPFKIDAVLTSEQIVVLEDYHDNDLEVTRDFYFELKPQIELRAQMSDQYNIDVRSKSDAQVAEAVIKAEIERMTGKRVYKTEVKDSIFRYVAPAYIKFKTPEMQAILRRISASDFHVDYSGKVHEEKWLKDAKIQIGNSLYSIGIGGLHSSERKAAHISDAIYVLLDRDVTSYYPAIILNNELFPKHLGKVFLKVYRLIFERRLQAKEDSKRAVKAGDKDKARMYADIAETLKIVLNGSFGKFGSPYSVLYSPDLMIQTTVTGQLSVLMLIEELELRGISVVSANTDGFVTRVPRDRMDEFHGLIYDWEWDTALGTEETEYASLYSQGVNAYLGITPDGKAKRKGKNFTPPGPGQKGASGMKKNPFVEICAEAVIAYLTNKTPIETTVRDCYDIKKFVAIQRVNGGAEKDGEYLGKAIRWYYSDEVTGRIVGASDGKSVGRSEGAKPCMELPEEFPDDIDYDWYVREATAILEDFGLEIVDPAFQGRRGLTIARMEDQKTFHKIDLSTGIALCGKKRDSIRDEWVETSDVQLGRAMCSKCQKA